MKTISTVPKKPVVVAEWAKTSRQVIRVVLDVYRGANRVSARVWFRDSDGELQPGRNGLSVDLVHLPQLVKAMKKALRRARAGGLIGNDQ